ncbi:MAG: OB-fold domain-containing protein [Hyphomonadaceae bacterium]|nr:OB-fold domain-containing protein [Hyphomonadaceae bacterium]
MLPTDAPSLAPYVKIGEDGAPYIEGLECEACGEIIVGDQRRSCPKCFAQGTLKARRLAQRGSLYAFTVVHRSFPGIETPFVSAIVDLEGGGVVKGNLIAIDPKDVVFGMPVIVDFEQVEAGDARKAYVRHVFRPDGQAGAKEANR